MATAKKADPDASVGLDDDLDAPPLDDNGVGDPYVADPTPLDDNEALTKTPVDAVEAPPVNGPPPPSTPDTPSAAAERRTAYERQVNDDWEVFTGEANHVAFINHRLAGRDVRMVAYDEDGPVDEE